MIDLILALLIGIWIGRTVTNAINQYTFREILRDLNVSIQDLERLNPEDDQDSSIVEVKLEQHQGQIYAFRKDNDQFLGQGTDRDTLINRLQQQFDEGTTVVIREADGADLIKS